MAPRFRSGIGRRPNLALTLAIVAGIAVSAFLRWMPEDGRRLALTPVVASVLADAGSPAAGAARPQVTVVIFTDYQCPVCKATDPALTRLLAADPTVRIVWKDWPIRGPVSDLAARTALAAHRQGRYAQVHAALMSARGPLTPQRIAALSGIDPAQAATREIDAQLKRHASQAFGLGLSGTPSYLVGPYLLEGGLDDRRLRHAVDRARKAGPPRAPGE